MMVLSIGMPGMFTDWGEAVIAGLIARAHSAPTMIVANTLDDIAEAVIVSNEENFILGVRQPDARLRRALLASGKPKIIFLDDPMRGALHLIANHGASVADAVRNVSSCCVKLMDFGRLENALVLQPGRDGGDLAGVVRRIAEYLAIAASETDIADVFQHLSSAELQEYLTPGTSAVPEGSHEHHLQATLEGLTERERAILDETLGTYAGAFEGNEFGKLIWPRDLFLIGDSPTEAAMRDVDIAGKARCLIYGPYMQLFAGNWKARVVLGFSLETVNVNFTVDVATTARISHTTFKPDTPGVYEVIVDFTIEDPDQPVEVRVFSDRAAFDGHIALGFVALTPGPVPVPQATSVEDYLAGRLSA